MPEPTSNITKIPAPRVPLIDSRTNLISREWFRFLNNIYVITGGETQGVTQIQNGGTGASTAEQARLNLGAGSVSRVTGAGSVNGITLSGDVTTEGELTLGGTLADVELSSQTTGVLDISTRVTGVLSLTNGGTGLSGLPSIVTNTTDFDVREGQQWLINNKTGSSCVVTLPVASGYFGRVLVFKNLQTQTVVSASSDVVPLTGGAAGTAILPATVGAWATLVSDGTNWIVMQS